MITKIEALNYRSLRYISQELSRFQTLIGPNGSGKSTFLDVVSFLGDMLKVGAFKAIMGERSTVPQRASDAQHLCWMRQGSAFELAVELEIPQALRSGKNNGNYTHARYEIKMEIGGEHEELRLAVENFWLIPRTNQKPDIQQLLNFPMPLDPLDSIVKAPRKQSPRGWKKVVNKNSESGNDYFIAETSNWNNQFRLHPSKAALANLPEDEQKFPVATWAKRVLMEGVRKVVLNAEAMRRPSPPGSPKSYLPDGSNLPWVVHTLKKNNETRYRQWIEHFQTAIPDLEDVETIERSEDRHMYLAVKYKNGLVAPSWVVSDGTLRMLALTLIAYVEGTNGVYLIEEPENGIHPKVIETVFQSLSSVYADQVLCASHSPIVLSQARPENLLCFAKDPSTGATAIVRGDQHPRLQEWRGALDLGSLFAAGVLG